MHGIVMDIRITDKAIIPIRAKKTNCGTHLTKEWFPAFLMQGAAVSWRVPVDWYSLSVMIFEELRNLSHNS